MSEDQSKSTRDFVDYQPEPIKILSSEEFEIATKYGVILNTLRDNIMTVKEIHDLYLEEDDTGAKTHSITQQTVYRYLEELEKYGIITVAGYRKTEGVKSSERIFGRTARTFLTIPSTEVQEIADVNQRDFFKNLGKIIAIALNLDTTNFDEEAFVKFYEKYEAMRASSVKNLYEKGQTNKDLINLFSTIPLQQLNEAMWFVQLFVPFIEFPEILKELKSLFE